MKYRSRTDIVTQILDAANGNGANKTRIMYKVTANHNDFLNNLIASMSKQMPTAFSIGSCTASIPSSVVTQAYHWSTSRITVHLFNMPIGILCIFSLIVPIEDSTSLLSLILKPPCCG